MLAHHLTETKKKFKNLKKQEIQNIFIKRNQTNFRRTATDKVLCDKAFNIAKNPKYDGYQRDFASMVYKFLITISKVAVLTLLLNKLEQLAEELHTPITRKFEKRKVNSSFRNNIWSADLEDMLLTSKFNKGICFFVLCYRYLE